MKRQTGGKKLMTQTLLTYIPSRVIITTVILLLAFGCITHLNERDDTAWWRETPKQELSWYNETPAFDGSVRTSRYLTMRDGTRLAIDLYLPKGLTQKDKLPTIFIQTRYVRTMDYKKPFDRVLGNRFKTTIEHFNRHGYAWVYVDARGSGASFGTRAYPYSEEEVADANEIVTWITKQSWSNGQVGAWGSSYTGGNALMLASVGNPALKAIMPRFAMFDTYSEVIFPGGLKCTWLLNTWSDLSEALDSNQPWEFVGDKAKMAVYGSKPVDADKDMTLLRQAVKEHEGNGTIRDMVSGIEFRDDESASRKGLYVGSRSPHTHYQGINKAGVVPYLYTGWYDSAFLLSEIHLFMNLNHPNKKLTIGPWDHGAYNHISAWSMERKPKFDTTSESRRFFGYYLKGIDTGINNEKPVHYYTLGEERWKSSDTWPPSGTHPVRFYLSENNSLQNEQPQAEQASDAYKVSFKTGTGKRSRWVSLVNLDHKRIQYRHRRIKDHKLLTYDSAPLSEPMEVTGHPVIRLYMAIDQTDGAVFAYLEDVLPNGHVEYVSEGLLRLRSRKLSSEPPPYKTPIPYRTFKRADASPMIPGQEEEIVFDLYPVSYRFQKGHQIRIALAGADRDHFELVPEVEPNWTLYRDSNRPSSIELPVMPIGDEK